MSFRFDVVALMFVVKAMRNVGQWKEIGANKLMIKLYILVKISNTMLFLGDLGSLRAT